MTRTHNLPAVYLIAGPAPWDMTITDQISCAGHNYHEGHKYRIVWPEEISAAIISPENVTKLRDTLQINEIILVDRLQNINYLAGITRHVNCSGTNYLVGRTPYCDLPRFPDMGDMYLPINDMQAINVQTVGRQRFGGFISRNDYVVSEGIALIAMVMHYVGLKIRAVGADPRRINLPSELSVVLNALNPDNDKSKIMVGGH